MLQSNVFSLAICNLCDAFLFTVETQSQRTSQSNFILLRNSALSFLRGSANYDIDATRVG